MTPSWWGILGLIGWAYLLAVVVYAVFRGNMVGILAATGLFVTITVGLKHGGLLFPDGLGWMKGQAGHFSHATITLGGMLATLILQQHSGHAKRIQWMMIAAAMFLIAGFFLRPLFGISKIYATPTWVLYCTGICCFLFPVTYWVADVKGITRWAGFLHPAGVNPLLTYILPSLFYAIFGIAWLPEVFSVGILGIARSTVFALFILGCAAWLTRLGIRLRL